ncbi:hypothetical protein Hanom_Chr15g01384781 [Helianthus anomalus]
MSCLVAHIKIDARYIEIDIYVRVCLLSIKLFRQGEYSSLAFVIASRSPISWARYWASLT